jgi:hypothetical protein
MFSRQKDVRCLTVTEWLLAEVADKLRSASATPESNQCYRLTVNHSDDPELSIDDIRSDDRQFSYDGKTVLVVTPALAHRFKGRTLDINEAGDFLLI